MTFLKKSSIKRPLLLFFLLIFLVLFQYFLYKSDLLDLPEKNIFLFIILQIDFILLLLLFYLIFRYLFKIFLTLHIKKISKSLKFKIIAVYFLSIFFTAFVLILGSLFFLKKGLSYWFEDFFALKIISHSLNKDNYIKETEADLLNKAFRIKKEYLEKTDQIRSKDLREKFRYYLGLDSIEIYTLKGELYKKTYSSEISEKPGIPLTLIEGLLKENKPQTFLQTIDSKLLLRVFLLVNDKNGNQYILAVGKVLDLEKIRTYAQKEKKLAKSLELFLYLSLLLLFLLVLFLGIWIGNKIGRSLTDPIQNLIIATQKIAYRDYKLDDLPVNEVQDEEIKQLLLSFKKMAEEIKRYETTLRKYNEYLKGVLNILPVGIAILKENNELLFINEALKKSLEQFECKSIEKLYKELNLEEYFEKLELGQNFYKVFTFKRKDQERHLGITMMKFELNHENLKLLIIENLEEREILERLSLWKEVAVKIAHDIKNPLTPIKLSVERLKKRLSEDLPEDKRRFLEETVNIVNRYVEELRRLAYDLYYFSKKGEGERQLVKLKENLEEVLELYRSAYPDLEIEIMNETSEYALVLIDPFQLKRIWINLLENSVKALNGKGKIKIILKESKESLQVIYEDSGPGLPSEIIKAINEENLKELERFGTGFMIILSILKLARGKIEAEKREEGGSRLVITLPKAK